MTTQTTLLLLAVISLSGCNQVSVKSNRMFGYPTTWTATDGKTDVNYYNGNCCCVAEKVLNSLADRSNAGEFPWSDMSNEAFKKSKLEEQCKIEKEKP